MAKWVLVCFSQHYKCNTRFLLYNSSSLLEYDTWWDKWGHRPTEGTFRSWCGNVHGFHFCQSQSAGVKLLHSTISLRWQQVHGRGEETLPSTSSSRFCPHTHTEREESTSMRVDRARVDDSEVHSVPSSSVRDSVKQRKHKDWTVLQVALEAQLCAEFTGDVLFCLWVGGGWGSESGGFPTSCYIQNIWKGLEKASLSGFVSRIGPGGAVAVTHADSPRCGFHLERRKRRFQACLWQLYMRILLKHLTSLCIPFHVNLALWLHRQPWCNPPAQASTSRQQEVTTDLKRSHDDIIPILDIVVRINAFFFPFGRFLPLWCPVHLRTSVWIMSASII